jgi:hypothetical protein
VPLDLDWQGEWDGADVPALVAFWSTEGLRKGKSESALWLWHFVKRYFTIKVYVR